METGYCELQGSIGRLLMGSHDTFGFHARYVSVSVPLSDSLQILAVACLTVTIAVHTVNLSTATSGSQGDKFPSQQT